MTQHTPLNMKIYRFSPSFDSVSGSTSDLY